MNYRHAFHAGNFADVFKHVTVRMLVAAMARKDKPFLFLDTHAGRGRYDLAAAARGNTLARAPEWPDGIGRLWERPDVPAPVGDYVAAVREFNRRNGAGAGTLRFYPGSPLFVAGWLREQDRLAATEMQKGEFAVLRKELAENEQATVQMLDGYTALRAFLPPRERRALVLIDPPFENMDEFERAEFGIREALERLPAAVVCLWYPLTVRSPAGGFIMAMRAAGLAPTLNLTLSAHSDDLPGRLNGCGMLILNPPWQIEKEIAPVLEFLKTVLSREPSPRAGIEWLVPE